MYPAQQSSSKDSSTNCPPHPFAVSKVPPRLPHFARRKVFKVSVMFHFFTSVLHQTAIFLLQLKSGAFPRLLSLDYITFQEI